MSEVFNIETPPNLIEATLARLGETDDNQPRPQVLTDKRAKGVRWLAAAATVLAIGLCSYIIWQPSNGGNSPAGSSSISDDPNADDDSNQQPIGTNIHDDSDWGLVNSWTGATSKIEKAEAQIITTKPEWLALWQRHNPDKKAHDFDFTKVFVVAVFGGELKGVSGYQLHSVLQFQSSVRIRMSRDDKTDVSTPFGIWAFDATSLSSASAIEVDVVSKSGEQPTWTILRQRSGSELKGTVFDNKWTEMSIFPDEYFVSGNFLPTVGQVDNFRDDYDRFFEGSYVITTQNEFKKLFYRVSGMDKNSPEIPVVNFREQWVFVSIQGGSPAYNTAYKRIDLAGSNSTSIHFRCIHDGTLVAGLWHDYGIWVLPKDDRDWVREIEGPKDSNAQTTWQEQKPFVVKQKFGVIASKTAYDGMHISPNYYLVKDAKTLANLSEISGVNLPKDFADFNTEMVLVIFDVKDHVWVGMSIEVEGESKFTYSVRGPDGVVVGDHAQVGFFTLPKHKNALSVYRLGPWEDEATLVKKFE